MKNTDIGFEQFPEVFVADMSTAFIVDKKACEVNENEVIKALKHHISNTTDCEGCPYMEDTACDEIVCTEALRLIEDLQAKMAKDTTDCLRVCFCTECVHFNTNTKMCTRTAQWFPMQDSDFCSYGKRKEASD